MVKRHRGPLSTTVELEAPASRNPSREPSSPNSVKPNGGLRSQAEIAIGSLEGLPPFGRLMRFWRSVFNVSQGELAERLNVSLKHVSYLETGRSRPSEALIGRIGHVFRLSQRDLQNLLIAANYFADPTSESRPATSDRTEREALIATLRSLDPFPASIIDPFGNVKMVNRAWVFVSGKMLGERIHEPALNAYRLFFMEGGWLSRTVNWENVASWLLMALHQEVLLHNDPQAEHLIRQFQSSAKMPRDWARQAIRNQPSTSHYPTEIRMDDGEVRSYLIVTHSVGAYPLSLGGRLWISIVYPKDFRPDVSPDELAAVHLTHSRLPY